MKLCECGCGSTAPVSKTTRRGYRRGEPMRFVHGHNTGSGSANQKWNGGRMSSGAYFSLLRPDHPAAHRGYVYEHRLVAEKALGRPLPDGAVVHHVNGDGRDNRSANLVICDSHSYHQFLHQQIARRRKAVAS